jgi:hypothetical protein
MAFGTLRRDSYFTPAEVLTEANQLNQAIAALAQVEFDHSDALTDADLAGWNAFVSSWRDFFAECSAWDGWIFRAENSTRDALLNFEDQYNDYKAKLAQAAPSDAAALPAPTAQGDRTEDSPSSAAKKLGAPLQKFGWELVAGAGIVVVGAVVLLAIARRGGIPI